MPTTDNRPESSQFFPREIDLSTAFTPTKKNPKSTSPMAKSGKDTPIGKNFFVNSGDQKFSVNGLKVDTLGDTTRSKGAPKVRVDLDMDGLTGSQK